MREQEISTLVVPPFTEAEFKGRVERAQALMREHDLEAVLATSEHNFRYFTGDTSPTPYQTTRPRYLLIPASGAPLALVPGGFDDVLKEMTWIREVQTWPGPNPSDEGVTLVASVLAERTSPRARIGIELGPESRLGLPAADFSRIRESIHPRAFCDASAQIFTPLRMLKSPAEIDRIRVACGKVSEAFRALPALLRIGMSEREACRIFEFECFRRGVEKTAKITGVSGHAGHLRAYGVPTDRKLNDGDFLFIDAGCLFDFYWCDFNRHFAFGKIDAATQRAYALVWQATEIGIAAAKPGVPINEVWQSMHSSLSREGSVLRISNVGRMGHSMGLWMPELPSIQADDETLLQPGMILNIEPNALYAAADGSDRLMLHEENIVITETGSELLTIRTPERCPEVAI